jgi:hypothetical protein
MVAFPNGIPTSFAIFSANARFEFKENIFILLFALLSTAKPPIFIYRYYSHL